MAGITMPPPLAPRPVRPARLRVVDPSATAGAPRATPTSRHPTHRIRRILWLVAAAGLVAGLGSAGQLLGLGAIISTVLATALGIAARVLSSPSRPRRHPFLRVCVMALSLGALSATSYSYTSYLTAPGAAPFAVRTSDFMRDHGLGSVVDRLEQRLYGGPKPTNGHVNPDQLPSLATGRPSSPPPTTAAAAHSAAPPTVHGLIDRTLAGEGRWTPSTRTVNGAPVTYTTFLRPDPKHTDVVASAVWINTHVTRLTYVPGTKQGSGWAWNSGIPTSERPTLVAAFNSGFNFKDIPGGYRTEGRTPVRLVDDQASLVLHANGLPELGAWGSQVTMSPDVTSVRQNLDLIVDNSEPDPGLHSNMANKWGTRKWQVQYTNRSGLGITADRCLIYVSGSNLTTESLARALADAGSVRAMELDIHASNPTFNFFSLTPGTKGQVSGAKLVPAMKSPSDRYLAPDQRDFFAVTIPGRGVR